MKRSPAPHDRCLSELLERRCLLSVNLGVNLPGVGLAAPASPGVEQNCGCGNSPNARGGGGQGFTRGGDGGSGNYNLADKWEISNLNYSYSNLLDGGLPGGLIPAQIRATMEEVLGAWAAVTPLTFTELPDSGPMPTSGDDAYFGTGNPDLRIGRHFIDGPPVQNMTNTLAHAWTPYSFSGHPDGHGLEGDLHFDDGQPWTIDDLLETGVHEVGHALGLAHANGDVDSNGNCPPSFPAIMHACAGGGGSWNFNGTGTSFLLADDINGITAHYGSGLGYVLALDGNMHVWATQGDNVVQVDVSGSAFSVDIDGRSFSRGTGGMNELVLHGMGGNDRFIINGTPPGVAIVADGAAGDDQLAVGPNVGDYDSTILENIEFTGRSGQDEIIIYDMGDNDPGDAYSLFDGQFGKVMAGVGVLTWDGADVEAISLFASTGDDTIFINSARVGHRYDINGSAGNDTVVLAAETDVYGDSIFGFVNITGGSGNDLVRISDTADTGHDAHWLLSRSAGWAYTKNLSHFTNFDDSVERFQLDAATGEWNNTFTLSGSPDGMELTVHAGGGVDTYNVGAGDIDSNMPNATINLYGEGREILDQLNYNDADDEGDGEIYNVFSNQVIKEGETFVVVNWVNAELTLNASMGSTPIIVDAPGSPHLINANEGHDHIQTLAGAGLVINAGPGNDMLDLQGGGSAAHPILFDAGAGQDIVRLNDDNSVGGIEARFESPQTLASLSLFDGARLEAEPGGTSTLTLETVILFPEAFYTQPTWFDIADNALVFRQAEDDLPIIHNYTANGYNGGTWDGNLGLRSLVAAEMGSQGLAVVTASQYGSGSYEGLALTDGDVIVDQTLYGDVDLDKSVDFFDFLKLRAAYGQAGLWAQGDTDFDGDVDFFDFLELRSNYGSSL